MSSDFKRSNVLSSSPISDIPLTIEQTVCKVIEESMRAIYNRLDKLVDKLDNLGGGLLISSSRVSGTIRSS